MQRLGKGTLGGMVTGSTPSEQVEELGFESCVTLKPKLLLLCSILNTQFLNMVKSAMFLPVSRFQGVYNLLLSLPGKEWTKSRTLSLTVQITWPQSSSRCCRTQCPLLALILLASALVYSQLVPPTCLWPPSSWWRTEPGQWLHLDMCILVPCNQR